jgi:hypothetical protein
MKQKLTLVMLLLATGATAIAQPPANENLKTTTSNEIGITISSYKYTEPSLSVTSKAINYGLEYQGIYAFKNDWFLLGVFDYSNGDNKYASPGSGTLNGIPTSYYNLKSAIGYDLSFDGFNLSPYVGLGYRFLDQKLGGMTTSTGALGYDRQSTYNYLPIGVIHRFAVNGDKAKLETTFEYDYLLSGNQFSGLSILNRTTNGVTTSGIPDSNNAQKSGYGLNLAVMYKEASWGFGPYFKYWNIQQSVTNTAVISIGGVRVNATAVEPANNTKEYGLKAVYRF